MRLSFVVTVGAVFCTTSIHSTSPEVGTPGFQSKSMSDKVNTESFLKPRHRHHIELPKVYSKQGDINLGGIFRFTEHLNDQDRLCGDTLRSPGLFQYAESMAWYLSGVNKNPDLLPGINLGYIIVDDCAKDQVAIARALEFADPDDCSNMNISETSSQVMSVMTASGSQQTLAIASIFSLFKVPLVAAWATSEEVT